MKNILDATGQTLMMIIKMAIEIITLPCELLNISDYWAIAYTAIIVGFPFLLKKRR